VWKREKSMGGDEMRVSQNPDASPQEMPEETYQRKQMVKTFKRALQELSAEQKAIFILKVYENQSYEQWQNTFKGGADETQKDQRHFECISRW
jgi:DNA-directed RNA polymerase specialized sigma24 family protein